MINTTQYLKDNFSNNSLEEYVLDWILSRESEYDSLEQIVLDGFKYLESNDLLGMVYYSDIREFFKENRLEIDSLIYTIECYHNQKFQDMWDNYKQLNRYCRCLSSNQVITFAIKLCFENILFRMEQAIEDLEELHI